MKIELTTKQKQTISQNQQQSLTMLQMNAHELEAYMNELAMENPLLEVTPPAEKLEHSFTNRTREYRKKGASIEDLEFLRRVEDTTTLRQSIQDQIVGARVPEFLRRELRYLAGELDERGFLPETQEDLRPFKNDVARYDNAVKVFQSLEPAGVGARSLNECLCIQLERLGIEDELPYTLCRGYLERIARGQVNHIANELGATPMQIDEARRLIASLNPIPANGYAGDGHVPFVLPDVEIIINGDNIEIIPADKYMPTYGFNSFYIDMSHNASLTQEERDYFKAKIEQVKWALGCVSRRRDTLVKCTLAIVKRQLPFFRDEGDAISPCTMTELASELGIHPSTVSRAVNGKHLICSRGLFPFSKFFVQEVSGTNSSSAEDVTRRIKELIAAENPAKPLSDRQISEILEIEGCGISRRTVAKYREAAMIGSAFARRQR